MVTSVSVEGETFGSRGLMWRLGRPSSWALWCSLNFTSEQRKAKGQTGEACGVSGGSGAAGGHEGPREEHSAWALFPHVRWVDGRCLLQKGQTLRFSLVRHSPKPKAQHVEVVTEKTSGVVLKYLHKSHYGFLRLPQETCPVWFAAACVEGEAEDRVPADLVKGAEVDVEYFATQNGQLRVFRVRCHSAPL